MNTPRRRVLQPDDYEMLLGILRDQPRALSLLQRSDVLSDAAPTVPDFEAVRNKRKSECTPAEWDDARELWLREQIGWMPEYHREHYQFLLERLDAARRPTNKDPNAPT